MSGDNWKRIDNESHLKQKAEKALILAKDLEKQQLKLGKKLMQLNPKTMVLR